MVKLHLRLDFTTVAACPALQLQTITLLSTFGIFSAL